MPTDAAGDARHLPRLCHPLDVELEQERAMPRGFELKAILPAAEFRGGLCRTVLFGCAP